MVLSLYTPKEACAEFQMDITTLYRNLHQRNIRHTKIGSLFRIIPDGFWEQDFTSLFPRQLKTKDLCKLLKLSAPSVRNLIRANVFPANYYGRTIRIPRDSFFSWLRLSVVKPSKMIPMADVSSFIDNIILSGGIYHGQ